MRCLSSRRPLRWLFLTYEHRQPCLQWCRTRLTRNLFAWSRIAFRSESLETMKTHMDISKKVIAYSAKNPPSLRQTIGSYGQRCHFIWWQDICGCYSKHSYRTTVHQRYSLPHCVAFLFTGLQFSRIMPSRTLQSFLLFVFVLVIYFLCQVDRQISLQ